MKANVKEGNQVPPSGSDVNAPEEKYILFLQARLKQECPLDMTTGIYFMLYLILMQLCCKISQLKKLERSLEI